MTWWPSPQDYNEAIQNPALNFWDDELRSGVVALGAFGLPQPVTGAFASVYRMACGSRDIAVRCFLRDVAGQQERYTKISQFVENDDLPYTVSFQFIERGIRVKAQWLPLLTMEWVSGQTLDEYIRDRVAHSELIASLAEKFLSMCNELRNAGIAHGDLQHGNIMVCGEELRLVDYDGMYVPSMTGYRSTELGHPNYQHPARTAAHFGPDLDNFSAWIIYGALRSLAIDPSLYQKLRGGDDCLLLRKADLLNPLHSPAFDSLERHSNNEIVQLAKFVRWQLELDPQSVPSVTAAIPTVPELAVVQPIATAVRVVGNRSSKQVARHSLSGRMVQLNPDSGYEVARQNSSGRMVKFNPDSGHENPAVREMRVLGAMLFFAVGALAIIGIISGFHLAVQSFQLIALLFAFMSLLRLPIWIRMSRHGSLAEQGKITRGRIISKFTEPGFWVDTIAYCLRYGYLSDGKYYEATMHVSKKAFQHCQPDSLVTVLYDPYNAEESIVQQYALYIDKK